MIKYGKRDRNMKRIILAGEVGTMDSLIEAANFVQIMSKRQNYVISAP